MLDDRKQCFICGKRYTGLDVHHCIGGSNRKNADKYGLTVYLCRECHRKLHDKGLYRKELQIYAQRVFERDTGTREDFMRIFGRNYIDE